MNIFTPQVTSSSLKEVAIFKRSLLELLAKRLRTTAPQANELTSAVERHLADVNHTTYIHPALISAAMLPALFEEPAAAESTLAAMSHLVAALADPPRLRFHPSADDLACAHGMDWANQSLDRQARQLTVDFGQDPLLRLGNDLASAAEEMTLEALAALGRVWPEILPLTTCLVTHFVWFQAPAQWSSTDPATFGAVYVNPRETWTMPHFFETFLHEGGHLHLMVKQTIDPLLSNPLTRTSSPLRSDQRPLKGVLHTAFVLIRMTEGLSRLADSADRHAETAALMARTNLQRLEHGLATLRRAAVFTNAGQELMAQMDDAHRDLTSRVA